MGDMGIEATPAPGAGALPAAPAGELAQAIDALVSADTRTLGDAATIAELHRQLARLDAVVTAATGAFDTSDDWVDDGAWSAAAWLATTCRLPRAVPRRRLRLARKLRDLPACEVAWRDGEITEAHVATVAAVRRPETEEALARDEKMLVDFAREMRFEEFARAVAYWAQHADPDGADDEHDRRFAARDVYLTRSFQGMVLGKITLDPINGTIVLGTLEPIEQELYEAERAALRARLGREPTLLEMRTPGQRRADAFVEMAVRARTAPADGRRPAPLFSVFVGYETMHGRICELAGGTVVAPGSLLPWLDEAYLERAVFRPDRRVEVSHTARLFTGATRRAVELRDRQCMHPFCDQTIDRCQVDHIVAYDDGGPTTQANGQLYCGYHNRLKERQRSAPQSPDDGAPPPTRT